MTVIIKIIIASAIFFELFGGKNAKKKQSNRNYLVYNGSIQEPAGKNSGKIMEKVGY